jgi:hypothetical protein
LKVPEWTAPLRKTGMRTHLRTTRSSQAFWRAKRQPMRDTLDIAAATLLDDPVWAALSTTHRALALGGPLAKRYLPEVGPFAALADRTPAAFEALTALVPLGVPSPSTRSIRSRRRPASSPTCRRRSRRWS